MACCSLGRCQREPPGAETRSRCGRAPRTRPLFAAGLESDSQWNDAVEIDGDRYLEVNWLRVPTHRLPILVRGANLDSGASVEFRSADGVVTEEQYLTTGSSTEAESIGGDYRAWRSLISIPAPGCYGLQVEGGRPLRWLCRRRSGHLRDGRDRARSWRCRVAQFGSASKSRLCKSGLVGKPATAVVQGRAPGVGVAGNCHHRPHVRLRRLREAGHEDSLSIIAD